MPLVTWICSVHILESIQAIAIPFISERVKSFIHHHQSIATININMNNCSTKDPFSVTEVFNSTTLRCLYERCFLFLLKIRLELYCFIIAAMFIAAICLHATFLWFMDFNYLSLNHFLVVFFYFLLFRLIRLSKLIF